MIPFKIRLTSTDAFSNFSGVVRAGCNAEEWNTYPLM